MTTATRPLRFDWALWRCAPGAAQHILDYGLWRDGASPEVRGLAGPNVRVAAEFWFVDVDDANGGWVAKAYRRAV